MSDWLDPSRESGRIAELETILTTAALSDRSSVKAILKDGKDALVALGQFDATPAVFKVYRSDDAATLIGNSVDALTRYSARLQGAGSAVVNVLASDPSSGLLVMQEAQGTQVSRLAERLDVDQTALMQRAARWIIDCAGSDRDERRFAPNKTLRPLEEHMQRQDALAPECSDLLQSLKGQRPALRGSHLIWGPTHGDFAPVNLVDDGHCLTAFDVQGVPTLPLIKVATHFLVARDFKRPITQPLEWGLDAQTTRDFLNEFGREIALDPNAIRFFVGHAMLRRLLFDSFKGNGRENAVLRVQNYLQVSGD